MEGAKGIDMLCAKARKYIADNNLFLGFSVNDIKDYQSLKYAAQDVEARNSAHPTAGRNHINFMYDLLRKAEPFQIEEKKPSIRSDLQKLKDTASQHHSEPKKRDKNEPDR